MCLLTQRVNIVLMIESFSDKDTKKIFDRESSKRLPSDIQRIARRKLDILHAASRLEDLQVPPSNQLEKPLGGRRGQHSVRINKQLRICFRWQGNDAFEVEIVDYH